MSDAANEERGEHELQLGGKTYLLRPSYSAIVAAEKKTGRATTELIRMGNAGAMPIDTAGIVAAELIRAGAENELSRNVSSKRIGELIYEQGLPGVIARLTLCLVDAATGGRTAQGEAKPVAPTAEGAATGD